MARLVSRLVGPASTLLLGLVAGCAQNVNNMNPGASGTNGSSGSGAASGSASGTTTSGTVTSGAGTSGAGTSGASTNCMYTPQPLTPPAADAGVNAPVYCKVPVPASCASLPFVVDTIYVPSGWMGDAPHYDAVPANTALGLPAAPAKSSRMLLAPTGYNQLNKDACTPAGVGRAHSDAGAPPAGAGCWQITFTPFPKTIQPGAMAGTTKIGGGTGYGWAGAFWQFQQNNWGGLGGGYPIPQAANTVSFWVRGSVGGERVRFFAGEGLNSPCADFINAAQPGGGDIILSTTWKQVTIDLTGLDWTAPNPAGGYYGGVLGAFGFGVGDQVLTADGKSAPPNETDPDGGWTSDPAVVGPDGGPVYFPPFFDSTVVFYIDDIEYLKM